MPVDVLDRYDWAAIEAALDQEGQAVLPGLLSGGERYPERLPFELYEKLVPIAHRWNKTLGVKTRYPARLDPRAMQSTVVRLRAGEQQPLTRAADGFPLRATLLLNGEFTSGEMILIEQRPRRQSRPIVVPLRRGDAVVFRVKLRHAVSRVRSGERTALELAFHDKRTWTLLGADGKPFESEVRGSLGGHRRQRIYGRLDCRAARQAIERGGYVKDRVFFLDEPAAKAAGFRPCAVCLPAEYRAWGALNGRGMSCAPASEGTAPSRTSRRRSNRRRSA